MNAINTNTNDIKLISSHFDYVCERASWFGAQMSIDADDLTQEAFKRAISHIQRRGLSDQLEDSSRSARAFLRTVVRTTAIDMYRRRDRGEVLGGTEDAGSSAEANYRSNAATATDNVESSVAENAESSVLWRAVESLNELQKEIVRCVYQEDLTSRETGIRVGKSAGAVRMQLLTIHELLFWELKNILGNSSDLSPKQRRAATKLAQSFAKAAERKVA